MRLLPQSLSRLIEVGVPRETVPRLEAFIDLLMRWNKRINLVSGGSTGAIWDRHVLDSAQLWRLRRTDAKSWMDLGSPDGIALFPKGETVHKELAEAERNWSFAYRLHPSQTGSRSAIVEVGRIDGPR
jgi:hypothetical protein